MKVISKHAFSIVNYGKLQQYGCTKLDALQINKDWGYMIKKNRDKSLDELQEARKITLEHMSNNHEHFSLY